MIASHYAEPLERVVKVVAALRLTPSEDAQCVAELTPGAAFRMLDDSVGWAWGYAGEDRRVGYVRSECLTAA